MLALFGFTIRQILGQRKLWLAAAMLLFPAVIVVLVRSLGGEHAARHLWEMYHVLMQFVLTMVLMPLVCLLYGMALLGAEIEQRTLVYLTTRRLRRTSVLLVRFAATWAVLTVLLALAMLALHLCVTLRPAEALVLRTGATWEPWHDLVGYLMIAPAGVAGFLAMFTTISLVFGRPLIVSVIYFVIFELVLGNLPLPARRLSISHPLRQIMVEQIHGVRHLYKLPTEVAEVVYPAGESGIWALLVTVAVLLGVACLLVTVRELVPARISRD